MLDAGLAAPVFSLSDNTGTVVSLADQRGAWVLLWWFPKADTPG